MGEQSQSGAERRRMAKKGYKLECIRVCSVSEGNRWGLIHGCLLEHRKATNPNAFEFVVLLREIGGACNTVASWSIET